MGLDEHHLRLYLSLLAATPAYQSQMTVHLNKKEIGKKDICSIIRTVEM